MNEKVAPRAFSLFLPEIEPLCALIIFFDINRPNPIPASDIVVNFSKSFGWIRASIPFPLSFTLILTKFLTSGFIETFIVPALVNFIAYLTS